MSKSLNLNKLIDYENIQLGSIKKPNDWLKVLETINEMTEDSTIKSVQFNVGTYDAMNLKLFEFMELKPADFVSFFAISHKDEFECLTWNHLLNDSRFFIIQRKNG